MEIDKTTLKDLSIFGNDDSFSIFRKFDLTLTTGGSHKLRNIFYHPFSSREEIIDTQNTVSTLLNFKNLWPTIITNGTLMVVHKFYETVLDQIPKNVNASTALQYKLLHPADFSLVKYSASHAFDLIKGMRNFVTLLENNLPKPLSILINSIKRILDREQIEITKNRFFDQLNFTEVLKFAYFIRYVYKENILDLIDGFYKLDAWFSMGKARENFNLVDPEIIDNKTPEIQCSGLYHPLVPTPVSYNVELDQNNNFIFLTGANMAGKSTFIKAVGIGVYLAHLGMAVPALKMKISLFNGLLSNINVEDNITKGESYFFNEVQRIKNTLVKITDGRKWLVLIDELFKGTNVEDAMSCSTAVIKGLIKIKSSLFILSTHLYEIGEGLKSYPNISFKYFETTVQEEELQFSYQLQNGISNDRLGYLILKREKVIEMLDRL